jgi:hypothetical protein
MDLKQAGLSVFGAIVLIAIVLAGATVWLFLTDPVTAVNAVNEGEISPFVRNLAAAIYAALEGLLRYL